MIRLILKSKIIRSEITYWFLIVCLLIWALSVSILLITNKKEIVLIHITSEGEARLITEKNEVITNKELMAFVREFISNYYNYSESSYLSQMAKATDLFSEALWAEKRDELSNLAEGLKGTEIHQEAELLKVDLVREGEVELVLQLKVKSRIREMTPKLKVYLKLSEHKRSQENPWGYQVIGIKDEAF